jgi:hypothetical protein
LWLVNDVSSINESVLRRFAYSVKFERLGGTARLQIWRGQGVASGTKLLAENALTTLAKEYDVSPAIIAQAYDKTWEMEPSSKGEVHLWIKKQLGAHLELSGQKLALGKVPPQYMVEALSTNPPRPEVMADLKCWRARSLETSIARRVGLKLALYGAPGSGKTALANYLAEELDLAPERVRASDIISAYVGQSEINLASLFDRHDHPQGFIIMEGMESFSYNRDKARRSWELTFVNEFMAALERFSGLFIGVANRPGELDPAARRRLSREVEITPLDRLGKIKLFEAYLTPLSNKALTDEEIERLADVRQLVPADFVALATTMGYATAVDNLSSLAALENRARARQRPGAPQEDWPIRAERALN